MTGRVYRVAVAVAVAVGLAIRLASVLARPHLVAAGDPAEYLGQANLLVQGKGWIEPSIWARTHVAVQTAKLPPLYTMLMALCSLVGFKSFFAHRIWSAILSAGGVAMGAVLGRDVAGRAVGVVTAFGVALYPNMWMSAGLGMSETISPIAVMIVLWAAYRLWRRPTLRRSLVLGITIGLAALARDELVVFVGLILLPLSIGLARRGARRPAARILAGGTLAALAVIAPWIGFNMVRFPHPVLITDRLGLTLASANCDTTWKGWSAGYWSMQCADSSVAGVTDESAQDPVATRVALHYIGSHLSGLPGVEFDRLGRTFGFYRVGQQIDLDVVVEGRPRLWAEVGLGAYYALVLAAPAGLWLLRRRGIPLYPLVAVAGDVVLVVLLTYGQTRFRATLEPVLVLLGAVAVVGLPGELIARRRRLTGRASSGTAAGESKESSTVAV